MASVTEECANCGKEFELEADVSSEVQYHPYGSTTAAERYIDFEWISDPSCPHCGEALVPAQEDRVYDELVEQAVHSEGGEW